MSYSKLFLCTWCAFAVIMFLQSWSLAASVVPALLPTLISLVFCGLSALLANRFWYHVLLCNLLIGFAFGISHFNMPENYTSSPASCNRVDQAPQQSANPGSPAAGGLGARWRSACSELKRRRA